MKVSETMTFDGYWLDPRFADKRPDLAGSRKRAYGDNIYRRVDGEWLQLDSHHSNRDGTPNPGNVQNDTQTNRVLIADEFSYWGGEGPRIPAAFRDWGGVDICHGRGHRVNFDPALVADFLDWVASLDQSGFLGRPYHWLG